MKNRFSQLKTMYNFYKWAQLQTGVANTFVFSCLAVDEMRKGNSSNGTMTRRGYDNLRYLYEQQTWPKA
jgi:hypothetical protein